MLYCKKCRMLFDGNECPGCGRSGQPCGPDDGCFLVEKDFVWAGMLADVLRQEGVPFLKENVLGAGVTVRTGYMTARYRFYVRYEDLSRAQDIVEGLFAGEDA